MIWFIYLVIIWWTLRYWTSNQNHHQQWLCNTQQVFFVNSNTGALTTVLNSHFSRLTVDYRYSQICLIPHLAPRFYFFARIKYRVIKICCDWSIKISYELKEIMSQLKRMFAEMLQESKFCFTFIIFICIIYLCVCFYFCYLFQFSHYLTLNFCTSFFECKILFIRKYL